jgi:hypothetical protein
MRLIHGELAEVFDSVEKVQMDYESMTPGIPLIESGSKIILNAGPR